MDGMLSEAVVSGLVALVSAIITAIKSFQFVQEGEKGIKLRFGRARLDKSGEPKVIEPGFVLLIPWIETLKRRHVRQQTLRFQQQEIMLKSGLIFVVNAVVIFRIKDVYKALFEIEGVEESIADLSMGILRDEITSFENHEDLANTEQISANLLKELKVKAEEWGVEFIQFKLTHCAPTAATESLVTVEAGARMKVDALKEVSGEGMDWKKIPPSLAAVLVGFPLVPTVAPDRNPVPVGRKSESNT